MCSISLSFNREIFPLAHKELLSALHGLTLTLFATIILKMTPYLLQEIKVYGTLAIYGCIIAACLVVLYYLLPETKDKTLQEIEDFFTYGKFRDDEFDSNDVHLKMKHLDKQDN